jgi:hypothetical protein
VWSIGWLVVFVLGTAYNMFYAVPEESWATYWLWHIRISLVVGVITVIWFTTGGIIDMRRLYHDLAVAKRSPSDDGTVAHQ